MQTSADVARVPCAEAGVVEISGLPTALRIVERDVYAGGAGIDLPLVPGDVPLKCTGNRVWDGTLLLIRHLRERSDLPDCVVDLGTGTGVAGLACHSLGARSVWLTDLPSQLQLVECNAKRNSHREGRVVVNELDWRKREQGHALAKRLDGKSLWILCCEVLYPRATQDALVDDLFDTILTMLISWQERVTVIIAYEERSHVLTQSWKERALRDGFAVTELSQDGLFTIFELRLPSDACEVVAARLLAKEVASATFEDLWHDSVQQFVGEECRHSAREFALSVSDVSVGLVAWHVGRVLRQYNCLRDACVRVLEGPAFSTDLDIHLAETLRLRMRAMDSRFAHWVLSGDALGVHQEVGAVEKDIRSMHTVLGGLSAVLATDRAESDLVVTCSVALGKLDITDMVIASSFLRISTTTTADRNVQTPTWNSDVNRSVFTTGKQQAHRDAVSSDSLEDLLVDIYQALVHDAASTGNACLPKMAESLLEVLDDPTHAAASEWLTAWSAGTAELECCEAADDAHRSCSPVTKEMLAALALFLENVVFSCA